MAKLTLEKILSSLLLYLFVCVLLSSTPLFNILGYEFSVVIAVVNYTLAALFLIWSFDSSFHKAPLKMAARYMLSFFILSLIPFAFMTFKGFFITNCNYFKGLAFYIVISEISLILGSCMGLFVSSFSFNKIFSVLIFLGISIFMAMKLPYDLLYTPKVDSYNHIIGFFAGPIYDEIVEISKALLFYRFYTLTVAGIFLVLGCIVILFSYGKERILKPYIIALASLLGLFIIFNLFSAQLGYNRSSVYIQKKLGIKSESTHFNFYYSEEAQNTIKTISDEFEFRFHENSSFLNVKIRDKIDVYIYPDSDTQKTLMGSAGTFIAKPSMNQIHMRLASPFNLPIKHEMVHVLAAQFGFPVIGISPRIALLEGLATAAEKYRGSMTFDEYSGALFKLGMAPDIRKIMGLGFFKEQAARAYFLSASFAGHLIENYGIEKFKKVYRGSSFSKVYGMPLDDLAKNWEDRIKAINTTESQLNEAEVIFRPKGIFQKKCAHAVASILKKAYRSKDITLSQRIAYLKKAHNLSGQSNATLNALMQAYFYGQNCSESIPMAEELLSNSSTAYYMSSAIRIKANCSALEGKDDEAMGYFKNIYIYETKPRALLENLLMERLVENKMSGQTIDGYLHGKTEDKKGILSRILKEKAHSASSELINTLKFSLGELNFESGHYKDSIVFLSSIVGEPWPELLEEHIFKRLGTAYFINDEFSKAAATFKKLRSKFKPRGLLIYADEWLSRIEFLSNR